MRYTATAMLALVTFALAAPAWAAQDEARTLTYSIALGDKPLGKSKYNAALWLESTDGTLLATVYVNETAAKEEKKAADKKKAYATLPVWSKAKRAGKGAAAGATVKVDTITGATTSSRSIAGTYTISRETLRRAGGETVMCFLEIDVAWEKEPSYVFKGSVNLSGNGPVELVFAGLGGFTGVSASERGKSDPSKYVRSATVEITGGGRKGPDAEKAAGTGE